MLHAHVEAIRHGSRYRLSSLSLFIFFVVLIQTDIDAQWSIDPRVNTVIATMNKSQAGVNITTDGSGGAIIVWSENNFSDGTSNIYAQRITAQGRPAWGTLGVTVCSAVRDQIYPRIVSDGRGGVIIAWQDLRNGSNFDIYAQHLFDSGTRQWAADGIPICTDPHSQTDVRLARDDRGGAFITWSDGRSNGMIYAQHVDVSGNVQWAADGIPVSSPVHTAGGAHIASDMAGGVFVAWGARHDTVSGDDIYAQRVTASGTLAWPLPGVAICTGLPSDRSIDDIASDGNTGFFLSWMDRRSDIYADIYAQHIGAYGDIKWSANGLGICTAPSIQLYSRLTDDGSGGMFITWSDSRDTTTNWDIYVQHVMSTGEIAWRANGIPINKEPNTQVFSKIASDNAGGAFIAWKDYRSGIDIYAQHMNANGLPLWDPSGVPVSTAPGIQDSPELIATGIGGTILAWTDHRRAIGTDIYAQNLNSDGGLGYPPHLIEVRDVPNDQGGRIVLLWNHSSLDTLIFGYGGGSIAGYYIYRGVTRSTPAFRRAHTKASSGTPDPYMTNGMRTPSDEQIYWEYLLTVTAVYHSGYSCTVPTLSDSGPQGNAQYYYLVRAYYNSATFWDSEPVIGYSVDNLSPLIMGKPAAQLKSDGSVVLHWAPNRQDTDIAGYLVYHSSAPEFTADSSTCIGSCTDTSFIDTHPSQASKLFYRIAAQDIHGNIGEASTSVLLEGTATYTKEAGALPSSYALEQNYPNPFNPSTVIRYALPAASYVRLTIYRTTGSEAATLFAGFQEAGYHEHIFDAAALASGMYFYRLQAGAFTATRKMIVIH